MARKPKGSHRAYKEWAPSVKLVEQNIIIITPAQIYGRATVFSFFLSLFLAYFYEKVFAIRCMNEMDRYVGKTSEKN